MPDVRQPARGSLQKRETPFAAKNARRRGLFRNPQECDNLASTHGVNFAY